MFNPVKELKIVKDVFLSSYTGEKGVNQFTKVQIAIEADIALQLYFKSKMEIIEGWFNIISPSGKKLSVLKEELNMLKNKSWSGINI